MLHGRTWMTRRNRNTFWCQRMTKKDFIVKRSLKKTEIQANRSPSDPLVRQKFKSLQRKKIPKIPTPPKSLWLLFSTTWASAEKRLRRATQPCPSVKSQSFLAQNGINYHQIKDSSSNLQQMNHKRLSKNHPYHKCNKQWIKSPIFRINTCNND